ncbi:MAG: ParB N-terminal domain-containing protein [Treponema sp.]|nr:ParB N-terminal domain-containing protein [Treponema sp.]
MKTLNFLSAGDNAPLADGGLQFSRTMLAEKIEKHDFFERLFKIDEGVLERIEASMRKNGFDNSQPLHIWHTADKDGTEHWYLIDGYTRFTACKKACITRIPVTVHEDFIDFNAAYKYVLSLQVNRRNLTSDEFMKNVAIMLGSDEVKNFEGDKAQMIAETLGVSKRTAQRAISLEKNANDNLLESVEKGELSVNQAYNKMQGERTESDKRTVKKSLLSEKMTEKEKSYKYTETELLKIIHIAIEKANEGLSEAEIIEKIKKLNEVNENGI